MGKRKVFFVIFLCFLFSESLATIAREVKPDPEIEKLREEISLLNLLRGLYLTTDQIDKLYEKAKIAEEIREKHFQDLQNLKKDVVSNFSSLKDSLYQSPGLEEKAQSEANKAEKPLKDTNGAAKDKVAQLEDDTMKILTEAQMSILDGFKPCLIPPKDLKNPVRVGQAGNEGHLIKLAELIFLAPDDVWKTRGDKFLDKVMIKMQEEAGEMSKSTQEDLKNRLYKISDKIRSLKKVDFELQKPKLADELLLINPHKALKQGHRQNGQVARFLLTTTALEVLPKWKASVIKYPKLLDCGCEDGKGTENDKLEADFQKMGENLTKQLTNLYKKRVGFGGLPSQAQFLAPVIKSFQERDQKGLAKAVLDDMDQLTRAECDKPLQNTWANIVRRISQATNLPLLNKENDPYDFFSEFQDAQKETMPEKACIAMQNLAHCIYGFLER
ncbi:MAG: hypothetical protein HQM08_08340 [Candidatus Riflebacteria bacterium]|nr:hypothetical protein [Candidatus Riflebacteria bacterium]